MTIIKCKNCGNPISDKAKKCVHCNTTLNCEEKRVCEECGFELDGNFSECPNCGYPLDETDSTNENLSKNPPEENVLSEYQSIDMRISKPKSEGESGSQDKISSENISADQQPSPMFDKTNCDSNSIEEEAKKQKKNFFNLRKKDDKPKKKMSKKKKIILGIIAIIVMYFIHSVDSEMKLEQEAQQRNAEYQTALNELKKNMNYGLFSGSVVTDGITRVWYNTIWEKSDSFYDKFTKKDGVFISDFNESINNYINHDTTQILIRRMNESKDAIDKYMTTLQNPPEGFEDAYTQAKDSYQKYMAFYNCITEPSGNYAYYSDLSQKTYSELKNSIDSLNMYTTEEESADDGSTDNSSSDESSNETTSENSDTY